jgi:predicted alpha/beta superfamily hydrolase
MRRWISHTVMALSAMLLLAPLAQARPVPNQPMDDRIAQRKDLAYRFETLDLDSADSLRHYRLWVAIPRQSAPAKGFPVVYLLDGNAALGGLTPDLLRELERGYSPVLVAVGYATRDRIHRTHRTLDYTPRRGPGVQRDPLTDEPSGGADTFLDLLETRVQPAVARRVAVNVQRQTLWGHSYGGLLVLHALLTRPHSYQNYSAASPSLWWGSGRILEEQAGFEQRLGRHQATLLLMRGDLEPAAPPMLKMPPQPADHAARTLLHSLQRIPNLHSEYRTFSGLGHGPMLEASLRYTLRWLNQKP